MEKCKRKAQVIPFIKPSALELNLNYHSIGIFFYLLPDSVGRTAFTTDGGAPYSDRSPLSDAGEHLGFRILANVVGNFEVAKCT